MKKILFMLPVLAVAFVSCNKDNRDELSGDDIIQFKDPNFLKALLAVQEMDGIYDSASDEGSPYTMDVDKNRDGQISVNEAAATKGVLVYLNEIEDMSEIRYFSSLKGLYCGSNQLKTLDVSNNTALTVLWCDYNQLTSLNLSNNTVLFNVDCSGNKLTTLDVSNNTKLEALWCSGNPLQTLTISESQRNASWLDDVKSEYPNIEIIVK